MVHRKPEGSKHFMIHRDWMMMYRGAIWLGSVFPRFYAGMPYATNALSIYELTMAVKFNDNNNNINTQFSQRSTSFSKDTPTPPPLVTRLHIQSSDDEVQA